MAEPGRADPHADLGTNQVCQDFFHWSFFQSLEACCALQLCNGHCSSPAPGTTDPIKDKGRGTSGEAAAARANPGLHSHMLHLYLF